MSLEEEFQAYCIGHNSLDGPTHIKHKDMSIFIHNIKIYLSFNYKSVQDQDFFQELPQQLKHKLNKFLVRHN